MKDYIEISIPDLIISFLIALIICAIGVAFVAFFRWLI
jgi:cell division protein FtsL